MGNFHVAFLCITICIIFPGTGAAHLRQPPQPHWLAGVRLPSESESHKRAPRGSDAAALEKIDDLLNQYVENHKHATADREKKYVLGIYGCPRQFGNRMHEFMNDFAIAVVLGRNLVWDYTRQATGNHEVGSLEDCEAVVRRKNWIPSRNDALRDMNVTELDLMDWQRLGCTEWDQLDDAELINPGKMEQYQSYALALEGSPLKGDMLERAKTLFALGPEVAFGKMFDAAFTFDELQVSRPTFRTLRQAGIVDPDGLRFDPESTWIALHLRHKSLDISTEERETFVNLTWTQALSYLPTETNETGSCAVLLATDDEVSEPFLRPLVAERKCVLVRSDLGEEDTSWSGEHGSHTGVGALRDVQLLAKADVFIGTAWSSFTQTIAELQLSRNPSAPFLQCQKTCGFDRTAFPKPSGSLQCGSLGVDAGPDDEPMALRVADPDQSGVAYKNNLKDQKEALLDIDTLIGDYIEAHNQNNFNKSNGFVAGTYGCPSSDGSHLHEFLNSFAIALVTGRNIAWEFSKQAAGGDYAVATPPCQAMGREAWIPEFEKVANSSESVEMSSPEELACSVNDDAVAFRTSRFEEYQALALSLPGADLNDDQATRARQLFALGPEVAYGKMLLASFMFDTRSVVRPIQRKLQSVGLTDSLHKRVKDHSVWVAVHVRHEQEKHYEEGGYQFASLVWNQTDKFLRHVNAGYGDRPCAILLSSDENSTEDMMRPMIEPSGCDIVRSNLKSSEGDDSVAGLRELRDMYLLSLADMVVGTSWSSFTQTVTEMVLARLPRAQFAQCNRNFCRTGKTDFPRPARPNYC